MTKICVDPGHGGKDSGAVGIDGRYEKNDNLRFALALSKKLVENNYDVIMTRKTDVYPSLRDRVTLANDQKCDLFISCHRNSASKADGTPNTEANGFEILYSVHASQKSITWAGIVQRNILAVGGRDRRAHEQEKNVFVLDNTTMPAFTLELGFTTSPVDNTLFDTKFDQYVQAVFNGIQEAFKGIKTPTPAPEPAPTPVDEGKLYTASYKEIAEALNRRPSEAFKSMPAGAQKELKDYVLANMDEHGFYHGAASVTTKNKYSSTPPSTPTPTPTGKHPIMGTADVTAEQMANYVLRNNTTPKITCNILELANLFLSEGAIEGIRGDIAFAQSIKETGFFKYGGDVVPEQNNYCGLGTTGGGVKGAYFETPQIGVRAQIQHLKAYASTASLKQPVVDPRYGLVSKGIAPNWEDLNGRWAVPGVGYGEDILAIYSKIKAEATTGVTPPAPITPTPTPTFTFTVSKVLSVGQKSQGEEVKSVQHALNLKIKAGLTEDGVFGENTASAVRQFQAANSLIVDGAVGQNTVVALGGTWQPTTQTYAFILSRTLKYVEGNTMKGDDVKAVQTALKNKGLYTDTLDGNFGPKTDAAVKAFQKANGLTQDGIVGPKTCVALGGQYK